MIFDHFGSLWHDRAINQFGERFCVAFSMHFRSNAPSLLDRSIHCFWRSRSDEQLRETLDETLAMRRKFGVGQELRARCATTVSSQKTIDGLATGYPKKKSNEKKKRKQFLRPLG